jgi:hypothetical protein
MTGPPELELVKLEAASGSFIGWTTVPRIRPCFDVLLGFRTIYRFRDVVAGRPGHLVYRQASTVMIQPPTSKKPEIP